MTIGSIGQSYAGLYNVHNQISIPQVDEDTVRKQDAERTEAAGEQSYVKKEPERVQVANVKLEDVSLQFNKSDSFDYIGKDKDINQLDIEKAVSDMRKDQMLEQYQFFVDTKDTDGILLNNNDGVVIRK